MRCTGRVRRHTRLGALAGACPLALRFSVAIRIHEPSIDGQAHERTHRRACALLDLPQGFDLLGLQEHLKPLKW
jgi:hypothetical protein